MKPYKPSNQSPGIAIVYGIVAAIIFIPIFAIVYAYAIAYLPFIYVNIMLAMGFGAGLAAIIGRVMEKVKCRNPHIITAVVVISLLLSYTLHWLVWVYALISHDLPIELIAVVFGFFDFLTKIHEHGTWGITSFSNISGLLLSVAWGCEALVILGVGTAVGMRMGRDPFCESCNQWCAESVGLPVLFEWQHVDFESSLEKHGIFFIDSLVLTDRFPHFQFVVSSCGCTKTQVLTINYILLRKGKWKVKEELSKECGPMLLSDADVKYLFAKHDEDIAHGMPI